MEVDLEKLVEVKPFPVSLNIMAFFIDLLHFVSKKDESVTRWRYRSVLQCETRN